MVLIDLDIYSDTLLTVQAIPMLMLAMGVAMAFTIDVYAENSRNFLPLLFKISKRTATLYMFGLAGLLNANEKVFAAFPSYFLCVSCSGGF